MTKGKSRIRKLSRLACSLALAGSIASLSGCIGLEEHVRGINARPFQNYVEYDVEERGERYIHYEEIKSKKRFSKGTVVFFHGYCGSVFDGKKLGDCLAKKAYDVYLVDLPGFGDSDEIKSQEKVDDLVDAVETFMIKKRINNAIIVGHSMGSSFIDAFAEYNPKKVEMMFSVGGYIDSEHTKLEPSLDRYLIKIPLLELIAKLTTDKNKIRSILEKYTYDDSKITQAWINEIYRNLQSKVDFEIFKRMGCNFNPQQRERNHDKSIPHYFIFGENDNLMRVVRYDSSKDKNMIKIDKAGHWVHWEKPEEVSNIINKKILEERIKKFEKLQKPRIRIFTPKFKRKSRKKFHRTIKPRTRIIVKVR